MLLTFFSCLKPKQLKTENVIVFNMFNFGQFIGYSAIIEGFRMYIYK